MTGDEIRSMVLQAGRYWVAGQQDANPVIRAMHLNYAKGLMDMLVELVDRTTIRVAAASLPPGLQADFDALYVNVKNAEALATQTLMAAVSR